jgi:hypothetical protein
MASPDEMRAAIKVGRETLGAAIAGSADNWERQPESGEGEDAWSPRQVAEHVIGAQLYFANAVCEACGYEGPESPFDGALSLATPADAQTALEQASEAAHAKIKYVTEEDLAHTHESMGTVEGVMASDAYHLLDHAFQLRNAAS